MEIESLLSMLYQIDNSKDLSVNLQGKRLINYGNKILPILASKFLDTTSTNVKSMCQNFYLRKGEIAIIIADRIEYMPYAKLTQIQNCIATFCEDNPNFIEYYLSAIRKQGIFSFQKKYLRWLKAKKEENSHEKV
jgi:hypothetical protein